LRVAAGDAENEIREIRARFRACKREGTIINGVGVNIDLIEMESAPQFEEVSSIDFGDVVGELKGIVGLIESGGVYAQGKVVEGDVFNAFDLGGQGNNAGAAGTIHEALRHKAGAHAALGDSHVVRIAQVAQVKLVDQGGAEDGGQPGAQQLRAAHGQGVKARYAGAALRRRVRIVEGVIVEEFIEGHIPNFQVGINARGGLVVTDGFIVSGG